jgi:cysteinyl-tRNA synthetase
VYDFAHIGHARTYIFFDAFAKILRKFGYEVFYLQNITDIDDKIIERARATGASFRDVARKNEKTYREDMRALGITGVNAYARASDYIPEIIGQVARLIEKGFAYESGGDVYFRVKKFKRYGALSRQRLEALKQFEPGGKKENPLDFALWKSSKPGEPKWKSPWGWGRPGWHIEDTAITESFFGPQYDVHGGGVDLIFPHHECEIAQQEAASGLHPFVRYWLHTGHLKVRGEKMAKSLGNFITIRDMLSRVPREVFRLLVLSTHWRTPLDYSDQLLAQARSAHERLKGFYAKLAVVKAKTGLGWPAEKAAKLEKAMASFYHMLEDDANTPRAIAELFAIVSLANPDLGKGALPESIARKIVKFFKEADSILGIIGKPSASAVPADIRKLIEERERLRRGKKWHAADELRRRIERAGWIVEDTPAGPRAKKK